MRSAASSPTATSRRPRRRSTRRASPPRPALSSLVQHPRERRGSRLPPLSPPDTRVTTDGSAVRPTRAERPLALGIDIGSSSIRAGLYDRCGRLVEGSAAKVPYGWDVGPEGSVRLPFRLLLQRVE